MSLGNFKPMKDPDIDRLAYYLGQLINAEGEIIFSADTSDVLYLGEGGDDKFIYFNINGIGGSNPAIRWNHTGGKLQFSYDGSSWRDMESVTASDGSGLDISHSSGEADFSVDVTDIIDTGQGLKESSNQIQLDFGTGSSQPARGNHTHALADLSNVSSDTTTAGNILSSQSGSWQSITPDTAGLVAKSGSQTISGDKTFSGTNTFSGAVSLSSSASTSSYLDFSEISDPDAPGSNTARIYARDNGSGKTQICVRFPTGSSVVIATEP